MSAVMYAMSGSLPSVARGVGMLTQKTPKTESEHNRIHGHFDRSKRTDCWTEKELAILDRDFPLKELKKSLPNRTLAAIGRKRQLIRKERAQCQTNRTSKLSVRSVVK